MNEPGIYRLYLLKKYALIIGLFLLIIIAPFCVIAQNGQQQYMQLQQRLATGWHTYNHQNVLSNVLMPEGLEVSVGFKAHNIGAYSFLGNAYVSAKVERPEKITPLAFSADGSYKSLLVEWQSMQWLVQSTSVGSDLNILVTPKVSVKPSPEIVISVGFLWNKPGTVVKSGNTLSASSEKKIIVHQTGTVTSTTLPLSVPYLALKNDTVGICTGKARSLATIKSLINQQSEKYAQELTGFGKVAPQVAAIQNAIGWNTTYDPLNKRVVSPVSRYWTESFGGPYVLFCWDNYFAAYMAGLFNKDLAYTNAIAITKSLTPGGFVPNYTAGEDRASFDRSQPPVGSTILRELYRKYREKWLVKYLFDDLLKWNRWWMKARATPENYLCWGSDSLGDPAANTWQGAAYESGLDNSPMYDNVPFNRQTHQMELADVGLMSLYIMDCESLADLAKLLGRNEAGELSQRATTVRQSLKNLWDEKSGQYLNYRTDIKALSMVTSPTNFYPLLIKQPTQQQAKVMIEKHLLNPEEYGGLLMLPSCARNTAAFKEQNYWRGRIWGPLNFLCYLGLRNYEVKEAKDSLVATSLRLFNNNYETTFGAGIYENYNGVTGKGRMKDERLTASDNYYHWGALLPFISVLDKGYMGNALTPLD